MAITKNWLATKLIFLFLLAFPFGQLLRVNVFEISFSVIDLLLVVVIPLSFLFPKPHVWQSIERVILVFGFTLLVSYVTLGSAINIGFLYYIRLAGIFCLLRLVYGVSQNTKKFREIIFQSLIAVILATAVLGWVQYLFLSDIRSFVVWGWDDHLNRLLSTHLDAGFTSILLVFGYVLSMQGYIFTKRKKYLLFSIFLFVTLLLTYSRAGYISFLVANVLVFGSRKFKYLIFALCILMLGIFLLPKAEGEGVNLLRIVSIQARVENYKEGFKILKASPLFGVGYNNICLFRDSSQVNSCSGLDSSLLLVLATTGVVGFFTFVSLLHKMWSSVGESMYAPAFKTCLVALLFHSVFLNSLFYPWVLGWILVLYAIAYKERNI